MAWRRRRPDLSADERAGLALDDAERVLAVARDVHGQPVVASVAALIVPLRGEPYRLTWDRIDSAVWDQVDGVLTVQESVPRGQRQRRISVALAAPAALVDVVREQVVASVVTSTHAPLTDDGRRGATLSVRRVPGTGKLRVSVTLDRGVDPRDPVIKARLDAAVARVRSELGG